MLINHITLASLGQCHGDKSSSHYGEKLEDNNRYTIEYW